MRNFLLLLIGMGLVLACEQEPASTNSSTEQTETAAGDIASIVRNPVTAQNDNIDPTAVAQLTFSEERNTYNFGTATPGDIITHDFKFTNTGSVPLVISDVRSTCGCTVAEWPREPIPPGGGGSIPVRFDTKNKTGIQSKPITITANTFPAKTNLFLNGRLKE